MKLVKSDYMNIIHELINFYDSGAFDDPMDPDEAGLDEERFFEVMEKLFVASGGLPYSAWESAGYSPEEIEKLSQEAVDRREDWSRN